MKIGTEKKLTTLLNIIGVVSMYCGWGNNPFMFVIGTFLCIVTSLHFIYLVNLNDIKK